MRDHRGMEIDWLEVLRLFLHVIAATIWVGGQLVLAALVPVLRKADPGAPKLAANQFNRIAWPAYWVLVATGVWNVMAEQPEAPEGWDAVLGIKVALVALSGVSAFLHTRASTPRGLAVWGALSGLSALGAALVGIVLAG
jgi:putative copper export protein